MVDVVTLVAEEAWYRIVQVSGGGSSKIKKQDINSETTWCKARQRRERGGGERHSQ